ncbi:MAG: exo-alpha-sialidase [Balneolaceae bacterium]|nr:exo-alpha-sialidase [Balneolaceae bacterium]
MSLCVSCGTRADIDEIDDVQGTFNQNPTFELRLHGGQLYAGTKGGLFRKPIDPSITEWESLGLGNATIRTFLVFTGNELLASAAYENPEKNTIAKTTDGGQGWFHFQNGYGGKRNFVPNTLDINKENASTIFARSPPITNVGRSINKGKSWKSVLLSWVNPNLGTSTFVKIELNNPENIWAGGSNTIFQPHLVKSEDGGKTWKNLSSNLQIIDNLVFEAETNDIIVNPDQSSQLLLGLSVGVFRSTDEGASWDSVYTKASIETFAMSPDKPVQIYASGQNTVGSLFFVQSNDFGDTWQQVTVPGAPDGIRVNDMVSVMAKGREVLYFATNKGVYSYNFEE